MSLAEKMHRLHKKMADLTTLQKKMLLLDAQLEFNAEKLRNLHDEYKACQCEPDALEGIACALEQIRPAIQKELQQINTKRDAVKRRLF